MSMTNVTIQLEQDLKEQADALFRELGLTTAGACTIFLKQAIREGGMPFTPCLITYDASPKTTTPETRSIDGSETRKVNGGEDPETFRSADELFDELGG